MRTVIFLKKVSSVYKMAFECIIVERKAITRDSRLLQGRSGSLKVDCGDAVVFRIPWILQGWRRAFGTNNMESDGGNQSTKLTTSLFSFPIRQ